ncbi:hypothetical protein BOX15_Mlig032949g2 [Macrostomum lignano]|uniref:Uncharacterized protein n=1 Tax=Macrostomum lignano TaxID=282301 RepID=A0A267EC55_9PLAT|nr:hypothetical protein BOX15_Mlig032949g2 [Macrostomum lignano]
MNPDAWLNSSFPEDIGPPPPVYGMSFDPPASGSSQMLYGMMNPEQSQMPDEPLLPPFPQPTEQPFSNNSNNSSSSSGFKPFQNNFMYFEPRHQPPPIPMNPQLMPQSSMFDTGDRQDSGCGWYDDSSLQRLIMDDEMYFGRDGGCGTSGDCGGSRGNGGSGRGGGGGCEAGWLPEDPQRNAWANFDPNATLRPPGMSSATAQPSAWQSGAPGFSTGCQLLPDI